MFTITNGLVIVKRAGFEIDSKCPKEFRQVIMTCIDLGWLKPVAHATEQELLMFTLGSQ